MNAVRNRATRFTLLIITGVAIAILVITVTQAEDPSPWDFVPEREEAAMDHSMVFSEAPADVFEVTATCLTCHADVADSFMATSHWTWVSDEAVLPGQTEAIPYGKINAIKWGDTSAWDIEENSFGGTVS